ncbi:peptidoglycan recognition family protein [Rubrivirga sp. IMCC43871]|uniref:peptidoglycan recognition protein family protein n=1 Tax=Rubrivirga sp. IMCC43871 TaxID=3391575 RepID=UPI00398F94B8
MRTALVLLALALASCAGSAPTSVNRVGLPADLAYVPRAEWGALAPTGPMRPHAPATITVHHTGTPAQPDRPNAEKLRALQAFSQSDAPLGDGSPKVAWPDVPYHYYIATDGVVLEGRDVRYEGETNTDYPLAGHVQVVVEGNFEETEPTPQQLASLTQLVVAIARQWDVPAEAVAGHGDRAPGQTVCPGEALLPFLPTLRQAVAAGG